MYKYLKLLVMILLLIIVSSCKKDNTLDSLNSTVHHEKMTLKSETNNTAVEITSTAVLSEYSQKEAWFYDFNNDGFLEMIQISDSGLYQYSIYDLSGDEPSHIGDFFLNDDVYGTVCKIYRCHDMENDEMFCVTEEIFKRLSYTESYVKKISLFSEGILYDTIVSKRTYYNDDSNCFIINDRGNIICGTDNNETAMSYFSQKIRIIDTVTINEDGYILYKSNNSNIQSIPNITISSNGKLYVCGEKSIGNMCSIENTVYINDTNELEQINTLKEYLNLVELSVKDDRNFIDDYSFLSELNCLKILEIKSGNSQNLQSILKEMTDLKYLEYNINEDLESLDFLANCSSLEFLYIGKGIRTNDADAYEILYNLSDIKVIAFSGMYSYVTEEQLLNIHKNIPECLVVFRK